MKILKNFKEINGLIPVIVYQEFKDENIVVVNNNNLFISLQILKSHIGYQYNLLSCI